MKSSMSFVAAFGALIVGNTSGAFVGRNAVNAAFRSSPRTMPSKQYDFVPISDRSTARNMVFEEASSSLMNAAAASNMWLSTIDADIAKISDNEFAPIFAGGILVMFGGVISALVVGGILESRNNYADVVAESYAQGANDKEFWESLSEDEKVKMEQMLNKVRESTGTGGEANEEAAVNTKVVVEQKPKEKAVVVEKNTKDLDMFSDYAEDA